MVDVISALEARVRTDGSAPLLIWHSLADGARVELSARTVANWADKVQWALEDAGAEPGDVVSHPLLTAHPTHWGPLVFLLGIWQRGAVASLAAGADVEIGEPGSGADLACSLHPLGLGSDVLAHPDAHAREALASEALVGVPWEAVEPSAERRLVVPGDPWSTIVDGLVAPILGGGSSVLLSELPTPEVAAKLAAQEHALTFG